MLSINKGLTGLLKNPNFYMANPIQFVREVRSELTKVVWPDRSRVITITLSVIALSLVVAAFLGAIDFGLTRLIEYGVNK